jgi:hypothetical protein
VSTTTATTPHTTVDRWVAHAIRADRWDAVRAFAVVLFAMLVWTVAWAGGAAAIATIGIAALALVAIDVHTRRVRAEEPTDA